jgi:hypothetical protein
MAHGGGGMGRRCGVSQVTDDGLKGIDRLLTGETPRLQVGSQNSGLAGRKRSQSIQRSEL